MMVFHTLFGTIIDLKIPKKEGEFIHAIGHYAVKGDAAYRY